MLKHSTVAGVIMSFLLLAGCVTTPTATVQVTDDRPFIMFSAAQADDVIILDGITIGSANEYTSGVAGMRIEPGTHRVQIQRSGKIILDKKFYLAEGVSKTFTLGNY